MLVALLVNYISINAATQDRIRKLLKLSKYLISAFNRSRYLVVRLKSINEGVLKLIDFYLFAKRPRLKKTRALYVSQIIFGSRSVVEYHRLSFVVTS